VTLRLPTGEVTVLLGEQIVRRRLMDMLDDSSAREDTGRPATVHRVSAGASEGVATRRRRLEDADGAAIVLVDHITDGLDAAGRRAVLGALATVAARGAAVLVDDGDCVAALAMADGTLRADPVRGLVLEPASGSAAPLEELYRAS
jgi:ABC-type sugar transport system ATPase subunit